MTNVRRRFFLAVSALFGACSGHAQASPQTAAGNHESCAIDPSAIVSDACASYSTLDTLNTELQPFIKSLTRDSDFFSYYRLNLYNKECPFWDDESSTCGNIACAVNTIENEEDIPEIWRAEELGKLQGPTASHPNRRLQQERSQKPLQGSLGANVGESCVVEYDDECDERDYCVPEDESATAKGDYVSLVDNPERFTGYSGPGAQQVWEAIYRENCFSRPATSGSSPPQQADPFGFTSSNPSLFQEQAAQDLRQVMHDHDAGDDNTDECLEKRVFYRVISGMHASISTHLCNDYLNKTTGVWEPNLQCFESRLHNYSDRISNLYFNYALVLRAVAKARPALKSYTFCSGDISQDALTKQGVLSLADRIASGPQIYDESLMFADSASTIAPLKEDFRSRFRNVSRTMDCVGCDKCRLWGKLQTAGYGTALKILFEFDDQDPSKNPPLRRTELVALVNTLDKLSGALTALGNFEAMLEHPTALPRQAGDSEAEDPIVTVQSSSRQSDIEDDGFTDFRPHDESRQKETIWQNICREFNAEFGVVFGTMFWVMKRWMELPGDLLQLLIVQLARLWDAWLGISDTTGAPVKTFVGWEKRYPPAREDL